MAAAEVEQAAAAAEAASAIEQAADDASAALELVVAVAVVDAPEHKYAAAAVAEDMHVPAAVDADAFVAEDAVDTAVAAQNDLAVDKVAVAAAVAEAALAAHSA